MNKKNVYLSVFIALTLSFGLFFNISTIKAEDGSVSYEEYISNAAEAGDNAAQSGPGKTIVAAAFNNEDRYLEPGEVLTPTTRLEVPNGYTSVWYTLPEKDNGYIFYHYVVEYKNKANGEAGDKIVNSTNDTVNYEDLDNPENINRVSLHYSYAAKITVNRYLNEVDDDNLLETEDHFGRSSVDFTTGSDKVKYGAAELLVETYFSDEYEFVEADFDYSSALVFTLEEDQVVNLIYKEMVKTGDVKVRYLDEDGTELYDLKLLQGNVGDGYSTEPVAIEGYKLITTPSNAEGIFTKEPQEVIYVYKQIEDEEEEDTPLTPLEPSTPIGPEEDIPLTPLEPAKPVETEKDDNKVPNTGINTSVGLYTTTLATSLGGILVGIRKRFKNK